MEEPANQIRELRPGDRGFRRAGIQVVEAYPRPETATPADNQPGPLNMYLAAGFEIVEEQRSSTRVRKGLVP